MNLLFSLMMMVLVTRLRRLVLRVLIVRFLSCVIDRRLRTRVRLGLVMISILHLIMVRLTNLVLLLLVIVLRFLMRMVLLPVRLLVRILGRMVVWRLIRLLRILIRRLLLMDCCTRKVRLIFALSLFSAALLRPMFWLLIRTRLVAKMILLLMAVALRLMLMVCPLNVV